MDLTTYNRQQNELVDETAAASSATVTPAQLRKVDIAYNHKFKIGDSVRLVGMQSYPEFNGEIVIIVAFRESDPDIGYYIESQNADLSHQMNFIYEKRMELPGK